MSVYLGEHVEIGRACLRESKGGVRMNPIKQLSDELRKEYMEYDELTTYRYYL